MPLTHPSPLRSSATPYPLAARLLRGATLGLSLTTALFVGACGSDSTKGGTSAPDSVDAPTLDACPGEVDADRASLGGTKPAGSAVWLTQVDEAGTATRAPTQLTATNASERWMYDLALGAPGSSVRFVLTARISTTSSAPTEACVASRKATGPGPGSVCGDFSVDAPPSTTEEATLDLGGAKPATAEVLVNNEVVAAADGSLTWTKAVPLTFGVNTISVQARVPGAGGESCTPVTLTVTREMPMTTGPVGPPGSICRPTVTGAARRTVCPGDLDAESRVTISGDRCGGVAGADPVEVLARRANAALETAIVVSPADAADGEWSGPLPVVNGQNSWVIFTRTAAGKRSVDVPLTLVLDATAPAAPTVASVPSCVGSDRLSLSGGREPGAAIIRASDGAVVAEAGTAGTWAQGLVIPADGAFSIELLAQDACGNRSASVTVTTELDRSAPTVVITSPVDGQRLDAATYDVTGNTTEVGCGIASAEVCPGNGACSPVTPGAGGAFSVLGLAIGTLSTCGTNSVVVRATDRAGNVGEARVSVPVLRGLTQWSSTSTGDAVQSAVVVAPNGWVHVAWADTSTNGASQHDLYYRYWDGVRCSEPLAFSADLSLGDTAKDLGGGNNIQPMLAADADSNVHLAWQHIGEALDGEPDSDILYRRFVAATRTFDAFVTTVSEGNAASENPAIAAGPGGVVEVLWREATAAPREKQILHRRVAGAGTNAPQAIVCAGGSFPVGDNRLPSAAIDSSGRLHVAWQGPGDHADPANGILDEDIYYCNLDGATWTAAVRLSDDDQDGRSFAPDLALDAFEQPVVVWYDNGAIGEPYDDYDVYMRIGDPDMPGTFLPPIIVSASVGGVDVGDSTQPRVAVDPSTGAIHVVWSDERDFSGKGADPDVLHRVFDGAWGPISVLGTETSASCSIEPDIAVSAAGDVYVTWVEHVGPAEDVCREGDEPRSVFLFVE